MKPFFLLLVLALLFTAPAHAHVLTGENGDLLAGLEHPLLGLDHFLAMLAVGMWAVRAAGRRAWAIPLAFVMAAGAGAVLALTGIPVPAVEPSIAASVMVLGLLLAFMVRLPVCAGAALVAVFAVFHGHAHGAAMPLGASSWTYGVGFLATTALLHAVGMAIACLLSPAGLIWLRVGGAMMAGTGCAMILNVSLPL